MPWTHRSWAVYRRTVDLDLRLVRAFVEVAETMHFGQAARRLHLAQSAVSRQVQRLEGQLGVALLDRTSRSVALTDAGRTFLVDAHQLLDVAEAARRRVAAHQHLTVGFLTGISPNPAVRLLRSRGHAGEVSLSRLEWYEQVDALADGRVDVCLGRLPIAGEGLCVEALYTEARMVLLPVGHRLAGRASVVMAELAGEPMVRHDGRHATSWDAFWSVDPRPDGSTVRWGPVVRSLEEKLEYVAAGEAVTIIPASAAAVYDRADVRVVPLADAPPATVVVTWVDDGRRLPVRDAFVVAVRDTIGNVV